MTKALFTSADRDNALHLASLSFEEESRTLSTEGSLGLADRSTIADEIEVAVRGLIMSGQLEPGSLLRQDRLASYLGTSRTPLREALQRLAQEGLISITRRGARVVAVSREDLAELYEIREVVESLAIRTVLRNITPAEVELLESILDRLDVSEGQDWVRLNREFHNVMYNIAARPQLAELIASLASRADVYVRMLAGSIKRKTDASTEHHEILEALRNRDEDAAVRAVVDHLRSTVAVAISEVLSN